MKNPVSHKQLAANRANATQSTGPRSPEGKARSAQNARKHGFTASTFAVVRLDELDEVALLRVERLHTGMATTFLNEALDGNGRPLMGISPELVNDDNEITKAQNRNYLFAEGFHRLNKYSNSFTLFLRYQAQTERLYRRAIDEFNRLKALRHELPNEPISDTQPEANETINTPATKTATPSNPSNPTPAGNIPGQAPRFRPNGEPLLVPPPASPPEKPAPPLPKK